MSDVFVSYAREDLRAASLMAERLFADGYSVFWDRELIAGEGFRQRLGEQLRAARCVVVLWSAHSIVSHWVVDEAEEGRSRGVLVPLTLDGSAPPLGFRGLHTPSLEGWSGDASHPGWYEIMAAVAEKLNRPPPPPPPAPRPSRRAVLWTLGAVAAAAGSAGGYWIWSRPDRPTDAQRTLLPIRDVKLSYWIAIPLDDPAVSGYRHRLEAGLMEGLEAEHPDYYVSRKFHEKPEQVAIPAGTSRWPRRSEEMIAFYLVSFTELAVDVYRKPVAPERYWINATEAAAQMPDLMFSATTSEAGRPETGTVSLDWELASRRALVMAHDLPSNERYWQSNGTVVSVYDLLGAQLLLRPLSVMYTGDARHDEVLRRLRTRLELETAVIRIGAQDIWLRGKHLQRFTGRRGEPVYSVTLPRTLEELNALRDRK